ILDTDSVLAEGNLSQKDIETVKLIVSVVAGCDYDVAAHSLLSGLAGLRESAIENIRLGLSTGEPRRDAFAAFVRSLVGTSGMVSEEQMDMIRAAGYSDQQLVEISLAISLAIFTNVFNRINDTEIDYPLV